MTTVETPNAVVDQLLGVLDEAFEHPQKPFTYFTDPEPDSGYFGTLAKLDAAITARQVANTSIAAQVKHVTFAMNATAAFIRGNMEQPGLERWQQSWQVSALNEDGWKQLQAELRNAYDDLRRAIKSHNSSEALQVGGAIAAVTHVAYHLGAIKQKIAILKQA